MLTAILAQLAVLDTSLLKEILSVNKFVEMEKDLYFVVMMAIQLMVMDAAALVKLKLASSVLEVQLLHLMSVPEISLKLYNSHQVANHTFGAKF